MFRVSGLGFGLEGFLLGGLRMQAFVTEIRARVRYTVALGHSPQNPPAKPMHPAAD